MMVGSAAACGPARHGESRGAMPADASWTGTWDTTFGRLAMEQKGDSEVTGVYKYMNSGASVLGVLKGQIDGNTLDFKWAEQEGGAGSGRGTFRIARDGNSFAGSWGTGSSSTSGGAWRGTRL
jgi:hypothetical protein